jgi:phosphoglycerate dehydrogenase-like enzyme
MLDRSVIFIAQSVVPSEALRILETAGRVVWGLSPERRTTPTGLQADTDEWAATRDHLLTMLSDIHGIFGYFPCDAPIIDGATALRVIMTPTSGTDHIDMDAATASGVAVVNAAGAAYTPVAEHVIGLSLSLLRHIGLADREAHHTHRQRTNGQLIANFGLPSTLGGKTIGIIGFGFIGREIARIARDGFRMNVQYYDPYFDAVEASRQGASAKEDLRTLLEESDVVCICTPLTPETNGFFGIDQLAQMKSTAVLINCSRGRTVATGDLLVALKTKMIAGAGLDVTDPEPLPEGHEFFALDNVVLTPHLAGISTETSLNQSMQVARDGVMALSGKRPFHIVNPVVWPHRKGSMSGHL